MDKIIIIGNGIAGTTAARHIRKHSEDEIVIVSEETKYFYSRTALMYIYMGHMRLEDTQPYETWFWKKNNIDLIEDTVLDINLEKKSLYLKNGAELTYDKLILATGSSPNKFGWPGQDLKGVQGLYHYQDLLSMEKYTQNISRAIIVGGGLIGIEMAEMLLSRNIPVTFLVKDKYFWGNVLPAEEAMIIEKHIREHHVDLRMETELKEILPNEQGRARSIITSNGEEISCQFVGLTAGVHPNIEWVKQTPIACNRGILINEYFETNVTGIYAIGDCAEFKNPLPGRRPIEQVWYTGKMHGETLAQNLTGKRTTYQPGIWFNSAKFFDIEYQTYGTILSENPEGEESFFWQDIQAHRCLRINYRQEGKAVVGFNFFGIRARHDVCENWIREKKTLREVISLISESNFDPEFFKSFEKDLVIAYNESLGKRNPISLKVNKGKKGVFQKMLFS